MFSAGVVFSELELAHMRIFKQIDVYKTSTWTGTWPLRSQTFQFLSTNRWGIDICFLLVASYQTKNISNNIRSKFCSRTTNQGDSEGIIFVDITYRVSLDEATYPYISPISLYKPSTLILAPYQCSPSAPIQTPYPYTSPHTSILALYPYTSPLPICKPSTRIQAPYRYTNP